MLKGNPSPNKNSYKEGRAEVKNLKKKEKLDPKEDHQSRER